MAYNPNVPEPGNLVQDDIAAMRENFQHLDPLAQAVDDLQAVSGLASVAGELQTVSELAPIANDLQTVSGLAPVAGELQAVSELAQITDDLQAVSELAPYVQALLDSRIVDHNLDVTAPPNGWYVRWENGLQVCFSRVFMSTSEDTVWTLPAAFINSEWVFSSGTGAPFSDGARLITLEGRTTNSVSVRVLNASGARVVGTAFIIAIGRWK